MGHFVERQATDQCLSGLSFQQARRKFIAKDGFQTKHDSVRQ